jgi:hypothetical protein
LQFAPADWWITDMYSFITENPASLNIDAIEDTSCLAISKENLEKAYTEIPKLERHSESYWKKMSSPIENVLSTDLVLLP